VAIGTDRTGSCKSNYHTITATTAPNKHDILSESSKLVACPNSENLLFLEYFKQQKKINLKMDNHSNFKAHSRIYAV
jgi:acetyl-CoA carboxylase beta subunit